MTYNIGNETYVIHCSFIFLYGLPVLYMSEEFSAFFCNFSFISVCLIAHDTYLSLARNIYI